MAIRLIGTAALAGVLFGCDPYPQVATPSPAIQLVVMADADFNGVAGPSACGTAGNQPCPPESDAPIAGGAWEVTGVPSGEVFFPGDTTTPFQYSIIRIVFNELMDADTIQATADCQPALGLTITANGTNVTSGFTWCYDPTSPSPDLGGAMVVQSTTLNLNAGTTYHVTGTVKDLRGNALPLDVTVVTNP